MRARSEPSCNRVVDLAEEGFDVAIRVVRTLPPQLVARPLCSIGLRLCASPEYLRHAGPPLHPSDLSRHNCLTLPVAMPDNVWRFQRGSERVEVAVHGNLQSNTVETLRDLALGGTGVTLLADPMAAKDIRDGRLRPLLMDWEIEPRINLYAVYLPTRHLAPKLRVFVYFLVERFATLAAP